MAIGELFEFDATVYHQKISSPFYSDAELAANIERKRHNRQSAAVGAGAGISIVWLTFGASALTSAAAVRNFAVASQKLEILEEEWEKRGHAKIPYRTMRDRVIPGALGAATLGLNSFMGGRSVRKAKRTGLMRTNSDSRIDVARRASYDDSIYAPTLVGAPPPFPTRGGSGASSSRHSESMYPLPPADPRPETEQMPAEDAPPYSAGASPSYPSNHNPDAKSHEWDDEYWRQDPFVAESERAPDYSLVGERTRSTSSLTMHSRRT
jgi:hypothetical protein